MDGIAGLGLVEGDLMIPAAKAVASVGEATRPRQQQLAAPVAAHLRFGEPLQHGDTGDQVAAEGGADLGDHHLLVTAADAELAPTGRFGPRPLVLGPDVAGSISASWGVPRGPDAHGSGEA